MKTETVTPLYDAAVAAMQECYARIDEVGQMSLEEAVEVVAIMTDVERMLSEIREQADCRLAAERRWQRIQKRLRKKAMT